MRKGISPVLASVLVVLVVITLSAAFYTFTGETATQTTEAAEESQQRLAEQLEVEPVIESVSENQAFVRNGGKDNITSDSLSFFLDDVLINHTLRDPIEPEEIGTVYLNDTWAAGFGEKNLRVSAGGASDSVRVEVGRPGLTSYWPMDETASPIFVDHTGNGNNGTLELGVGETGRINVSDDTWSTISFDNTYTEPAVVATTNTKTTGQHPLIPQVRNVQSGSAEVRLCDHDDDNRCEAHGEETLGYLVIDVSETRRLEGIEAGNTTVPAGSGSPSAHSVTFEDTFDSEPVVFATPNSLNTGNDFITWVKNVDKNGFDILYCNHSESSSNACGSTEEEQVGWVAVNPDNIPLEGVVAGKSDAKLDNWYWASREGDDGDLRPDFSGNFSERPVALAMIQGDEGGQDPKISEARGVTTSTMDYRFCEHDNGEDCDGHSDNFVAWLAAENTTELVTKEAVAPGREKGAAQFDGRNDHVAVSDSQSLDVRDGITIVTWVYVARGPDIGGDNEWRGIVNKGHLKPYHLLLEEDSRGMTGSVYIDGNRQALNSNVDAANIAGGWTHVAFTYDTSTGEAAIYVNGTPENTAIRDTGQIDTDDERLYIGDNDGSGFGGAAHRLNGTLDEVQIYDRALPQDELPMEKDDIYVVNSA